MCEIYEAVRKKAVGYRVKETVSEYAVNDGNLEMIRKKVTEKEVPPDLSALKMLKDEFGQEYSIMSEEELLEMLKEENYENRKESTKN